MPRSRSRVNKDPTRGMRNRQRGLSKKAHLFHKDYNADVLVIIRRPDGNCVGYQSQPNLLSQFHSVPENSLLGPHEYSQNNELDSDSSSPSRSMRSSSVSSSISAGSIFSEATNKSSSVSEVSDLVSLPLLEPTLSVESIDVLLSVPTPPQADTPLIMLSSIDRELFISLLSQNDNSSLYDDGFGEIALPEPEPAELADADRVANESPCLAQPRPVSVSQREAIMSLLDQFL